MSISDWSSDVCSSDLELVLIFGVVKVENYALDRAYDLTLRFIKMTHAFGTFGRLYFVDFRAHVDGIVGALRLANITVDAFFGNAQRHGNSWIKQPVIKTSGPVLKKGMGTV